MRAHYIRNVFCFYYYDQTNQLSEIVKERYLTDTCRAEMEKLIDKDFAKYKAQGIVEKMISAVMEISTYRKTVSIWLYLSFCLAQKCNNFAMMVQLDNNIPIIEIIGIFERRKQNYYPSTHQFDNRHRQKIK